MINNASNLRRKLLAWYRKNRRDLPWRRTKDPYRIWVSEIMLQQTQVATVIPYYRRFLRRFPNVNTLARAKESEVLSLWAGLGYYSRAKNLHRVAQEVMSRFGGKLPKTPDELRSLPGIGRYTAGAIASIAFGVPAPVVDGNVIRVLSRLFAVGCDLSKPRGQEKIWDLAGRLVDREDPGSWNQALMELGATVCLPAAPLCHRCPVARSCKAFRVSKVRRYPNLGPKAKSVPVHLACAVVRKGSKILIEERPQGGRFLPGHWGLPLVELGRGEKAEEGFKKAYRDGVRMKERTGSFRHSITNHRLRVDVFEGSAVKILPKLRWVSKARLGQYLISSLFHKVLTLGNQ